MNKKLIEFMQEDLKLRHSKRSNKINLTINGDDKQVKTVGEAATIIAGSVSKYKNNANWQEFKASAQSELKDGEELFEKLPSILEEHITYILSSKTSASLKMNENVEASAFNSFVKELAELPKVGFNSVDKMIMKRFRYCAADTCIYIKKNGRLKLIGKLELLKKDPTQAGICKVIKEEIGNEWNEGTPMKIDEYIGFCLKTVTELRHFIISETKRKMDAGEQFENICLDIDGEVFRPSEKSYRDDLNALENAAHNYSIEKLWTMVPCSIFTSRVITLKAVFNTYEIARADGGAPYKVNDFVKYIYDVVRSGEALTEAAYLKNIFTTYAAELKDDEAFMLDEVPRTYADGDTDALFRYDGETLKKSLEGIDCYKKFDDCSNLTLLKSWMNEDEFRLTMAWAYAAVHPCTVKSNIALLLWTGGGTGKSSFVAMLKYAMMLASGAREEDLYFEIKGDKFMKDDKNWMPDGQIGLPKAALVNIDEATTECIELYKNFSGSADKNRLSLRLNYENAVDYDVKGKFIFTTNKGLQLTSDDGSLLRRVAVIKHTGTQNIIGKQPKTNEEIVLEYKKQIPMMLALGKKALEELKKLGYSSIDDYAMSCEGINKNLQESTSTSSNTVAYAQMWDLLEEKFSGWKSENGSYKMQGGVLKQVYEEVCDVNGDDARWFSSFRHFIKDRPELFTSENNVKQRRGFISYDNSAERFDFCDKNCNNIYELFPLKNAAQEAEE